MEKTDNRFFDSLSCSQVKSDLLSAVVDRGVDFGNEIVSGADCAKVVLFPHALSLVEGSHEAETGSLRACNDPTVLIYSKLRSKPIAISVTYASSLTC